MALETLKNLDEIGGFKILHIRSRYDDDCILMNGDEEDKRIPWSDLPFHEDDAPIRHYMKENILAFNIQDGPIREHGVNGCQVDTIIEVAYSIIYGLNLKFPCSENGLALDRLRGALSALHQRTLRRSQQGIEGTSQEHRADSDGHE